MAQKPKIENLTDEKLVKLTLKDQNFFVYIINRYEGKLAAYIRRISNFSKEDIEDILQDVFIKVYRNLNGFDVSLKFSSWIYRITHNEVISRYRKTKKIAKMSQEINDEILDKIVDEVDIEKDIDGKQVGKTIGQVMNEMDLKYKEILVLRFIEEKSYKEISDILRKPEGTVATMINRAKKQFKKIYEQRFK
ncbi:RNA polymerase sigma factor [Candidatus Falkowbacteria bacterium]|mgnify:CR=1|jgi:RNA polymerase sigma-70 factor, ECF subfamily|nr:RNA polymerase sigma factor [Candidatus Falkowbacteria bacterium]MBT7007324.1 RNA polymerase sigma factor [Candidatus Falkowbacteria bacterium]